MQFAGVVPSEEASVDSGTPLQPFIRMLMLGYQLIDNSSPVQFVGMLMLVCSSLVLFAVHKQLLDRFVW